MKTEILATFTDGDIPVTWEKKGRRHFIRYGLQVKEFTDSDSCVAVAKEFGLCARHSLECAGKLG